MLKDLKKNMNTIKERKRRYKEEEKLDSRAENTPEVPCCAAGVYCLKNTAADMTRGQSGFDSTPDGKKPSETDSLVR